MDKRKRHVSQERWTHWGRLGKAKAWEACALSLDIDPSTMRDAHSPWGAGPASRFIRGEEPKRQVERELRDRYRVIESDLAAKKHFSGLDFYTAFRGLDQEIDFSEFVSWLKSHNYEEVPDGLLAIASNAGAPSGGGPAGNQAGQHDEARDVSRFQQQESRILSVIRSLGHDPAALPENKGGKPGVKAAVRDECSYSPKVFDAAWERLRKMGLIRDAQHK